MVAPLIKGAKVVKGPLSRSTQTNRPGSQRTQRPSARNRENPEERSTPSQTQPPRTLGPSGRGGILRRGLMPQGAGIEQRVWAFSAAYFIIACTIPFYAPQLFFFMFGIAGIGFEVIPVVNFVLPGTEVFLLAWALTLLIGVGSMLFAAVIFSLRGIDAFGGSKSFVFICCMVAYLTLFLSVIPWVVIWTLFVAYTYATNEEA